MIKTNIKDERYNDKIWIQLVVVVVMLALAVFSGMPLWYAFAIIAILFGLDNIHIVIRKPSDIYEIIK